MTPEEEELVPDLVAIAAIPIVLEVCEYATVNTHTIEIQLGLLGTTHTIETKPDPESYAFDARFAITSGILTVRVRPLVSYDSMRIYSPF